MVSVEKKLNVVCSLSEYQCSAYTYSYQVKIS